jgi:branched-chain amino acid transport system substrate-binding protein
MHLDILPWEPDMTPNPAATKFFIAEWKKRGFDFAGVTESFRGYDGIRTIVAAIKIAGSDDPKKIKEALWSVDIMGLNGPIKFTKQGPAGKESGQSKPNVYMIQISNGKVTLVPQS